jgi:hypothetical protein
MMMIVALQQERQWPLSLLRQYIGFPRISITPLLFAVHFQGKKHGEQFVSSFAFVSWRFSF